MLEEGGIATTGQRGIHILGHLAQSALICFGPRRERQHTFTLLDEWKRSFKRKAVVITAEPFTALPDLRATLEAPAKRYGKFLGMPVSFA